MNEKMIYEQTIAAKLEALPLPDMADAIWARIEAQLDLDMPTDEGNGPNSPNFPTGGVIIGGFSILVIAVLYFFLSSTNNQTNTPTLTPASPAPVSTQPVLPMPAGPPGVTISNPNSPAGNAIAPANALPQPTVTDSTNSTTLQLPISIDSSRVADAVSLPAKTTPQATDTVAVKKGRGVPGLTDDDYRIVPKKDSSKNN